MINQIMWHEMTVCWCLLVEDGAGWARTIKSLKSTAAVITPLKWAMFKKER